MRILINECLEDGKIPDTWQNVQVLLVFKKGDKLKFECYHNITLANE